VAGGLTAALLGLAALLPLRPRPTRQSLAARVCLAAAPAWLLLSAASLLAAWQTGHALAQYENCVRQALEQPEPLTGSHASYAKMLEELRTWDPNTLAQAP
jgi:hypothetical protein